MHKTSITEKKYVLLDHGRPTVQQDTGNANNFYQP